MKSKNLAIPLHFTSWENYFSLISRKYNFPSIIRAATIQYLTVRYGFRFQMLGSVFFSVLGFCPSS